MDRSARRFADSRWTAAILALALVVLLALADVVNNVRLHRSQRFDLLIDEAALLYSTRRGSEAAAGEAPEQPQAADDDHTESSHGEATGA